MAKQRVIDELRKRFPGKWTYDPNMFAWNHEAGWHVYAEAKFCPQHPWDDDTFVRQYRRSDTYELVLQPFDLGF